jgi:hypothetical protein
VALSPRANYTDWATATCRRNSVAIFFVDRGVSRVQRGGSLTVVILSFLDRSRYFFLQVVPHLSSQGLSGPRSRPTATQKIWQCPESNPGPLGLQSGTLTTRPQRRPCIYRHKFIYIYILCVCVCASACVRACARPCAWVCERAHVMKCRPSCYLLIGMKYVRLVEDNILVSTLDQEIRQT